MIYKIFPSLILLLFLVACNTPKSDEKIITKQIEYWVSITDEESDGNNFLVDEETKNWFLNDLLLKVQNGDLPVYYYRLDTLEKMDDKTLHDIFYSTDTIYEFDDVKMNTTIIHDTLDINSITRFKFREQWTYNASKSSFTKKVIAIAPMQTRYLNMDEIMGYKGLFWVYLN